MYISSLYVEKIQMAFLLVLPITEITKYVWPWGSTVTGWKLATDGFILTSPSIEGCKNQSLMLYFVLFTHNS